MALHKKQVPWQNVKGASVNYFTREEDAKLLECIQLVANAIDRTTLWSDITKKWNQQRNARKCRTEDALRNRWWRIRNTHRKTSCSDSECIVCKVDECLNNKNWTRAKYMCILCNNTFAHRDYCMKHGKKMHGVHKGFSAYCVPCDSSNVSQSLDRQPIQAKAAEIQVQATEILRAEFLHDEIPGGLLPPLYADVLFVQKVEELEELEEPVIMECEWAS